MAHVTGTENPKPIISKITDYVPPIMKEELKDTSSNISKVVKTQSLKELILLFDFVYEDALMVNLAQHINSFARNTSERFATVHERANDILGKYRGTYPAYALKDVKDKLIVQSALAKDFDYYFKGKTSYIKDGVERKSMFLGVKETLLEKELRIRREYSNWLTYLNDTLKTKMGKVSKESIKDCESKLQILSTLPPIGSGDDTVRDSALNDLCDALSTALGKEIPKYIHTSSEFDDTDFDYDLTDVFNLSVYLVDSVLWKGGNTFKSPIFQYDVVKEDASNLTKTCFNYINGKHQHTRLTREDSIELWYYWILDGLSSIAAFVLRSKDKENPYESFSILEEKNAPSLLYIVAHTVGFGFDDAAGNLISRLVSPTPKTIGNFFAEYQAFRIMKGYTYLDESFIWNMHTLPFTNVLFATKDKGSSELKHISPKVVTDNNCFVYYDSSAPLDYYLMSTHKAYEYYGGSNALSMPREDVAKRSNTYANSLYLMNLGEEFWGLGTVYYSFLLGRTYNISVKEKTVAKRTIALKDVIPESRITPHLEEDGYFRDLTLFREGDEIKPLSIYVYGKKVDYPFFRQLDCVLNLTLPIEYWENKSRYGLSLSYIVDNESRGADFVYYWALLLENNAFGNTLPFGIFNPFQDGECRMIGNDRQIYRCDTLPKLFETSTSHSYRNEFLVHRNGFNSILTVESPEVRNYSEEPCADIHPNTAEEFAKHYLSIVKKEFDLHKPSFISDLSNETAGMELWSLLSILSVGTNTNYILEDFGSLRPCNFVGGLPILVTHKQSVDKEGRYRFWGIKTDSYNLKYGIEKPPLPESYEKDHTYLKVCYGTDCNVYHRPGRRDLLGFRGSREIDREDYMHLGNTRILVYDMRKGTLLDRMSNVIFDSTQSLYKVTCSMLREKGMVDDLRYMEDEIERGDGTYTCTEKLLSYWTTQDVKDLTKKMGLDPLERLIYILAEPRYSLPSILFWDFYADYMDTQNWEDLNDMRKHVTASLVITVLNGQLVIPKQQMRLDKHMKYPSSSGFARTVMRPVRLFVGNILTFKVIDKVYKQNIFNNTSRRKSSYGYYRQPSLEKCLSKEYLPAEFHRSGNFVPWGDDMESTLISCCSFSCNPVLRYYGTRDKEADSRKTLKYNLYDTNNYNLYSVLTAYSGNSDRFSSNRLAKSRTLYTFDDSINELCDKCLSDATYKGSKWEHYLDNLDMVSKAATLTDCLRNYDSQKDTIGSESTQSEVFSLVQDMFGLKLVYMDFEQESSERKSVRRRILPQSLFMRGVFPNGEKSGESSLLGDTNLSHLVGMKEPDRCLPRLSYISDGTCDDTSVVLNESEPRIRDELEITGIFINYKDKLLQVDGLKDNERLDDLREICDIQFSRVDEHNEKISRFLKIEQGILGEIQDILQALSYTCYAEPIGEVANQLKQSLSLGNEYADFMFGLMSL